MIIIIIVIIIIIIIIIIIMNNCFLSAIAIFFRGEFYYIVTHLLIRKGERWLYSQCSGEKDGYG